MSYLNTNEESNNQERTVALVVICGLSILAINMGVRQSLGLFLPDLALHLKLSMNELSFGFAVQNLVWGAAAPIAGVAAERVGTARILALGGLIYALGLAALATSGSAWIYQLSNGVLVGIGVGATTYPLVLSAVSRHVSEKNQSLVLGLVSAGGSLGQFVFALITEYASNRVGWQGTLWIFAVAALMLIVLSPALRSKPSRLCEGHEEKSSDLDYRFYLLAMGFFVCGFHVAFISVHLPNLVAICGLPTGVASNSLALIGLVNVAGTILAGWLGGRYYKPYLLSGIYAARALLLIVFLLLPKTALVFYIFSLVMGVLWLSTVPLTSGAIAQFFGATKLASLFGMVMLSHQIGAFFGAWLGGIFLDHSGSYDIALIVSAGLGLFAALIHLPIRKSDSAGIQTA